MAPASAVNCVFFFRLCDVCMRQTSYVNSVCPTCVRDERPTGYHVIRYNYWEEKWNHGIPICQEGNPMNGYWDEDTRKNRCILRCDSGYEPTGCHVIRYSHREGKGNHDIPICQKKWLVSGKTLVAVGTGAAVVAATPFVLAGVGFTSAGVAAGSVAAMLQTPCTAAGSLFAWAQSAGVVGTTATTKGVIWAGTWAFTYATSSAISNCDPE